MKKKDLQSLNEELFNSEEILSNELRELVEVVGGAATPATSKMKTAQVVLMIALVPLMIHQSIGQIHLQDLRGN